MLRNMALLLLSASVLLGIGHEQWGYGKERMLIRQADLEGYISHENGNPAPGYRVRVYDNNNNLIGTTYSGSDGHYCINIAPWTDKPLPWRITVYWDQDGQMRREYGEAYVTSGDFQGVQPSCIDPGNTYDHFWKDVTLSSLRKAVP